MFDLRARREALKLSQDDVAAAADVSRGTVSKWESGDIANMKRDKIAAIAKLLRVSPLEILGMEDAGEAPSLPSHSYPYIPADIAAGAPATVDGLTNSDLDTIDIPDAIMGRWAGRRDITLMHVNGQSMNRVIPDQSLIAVQKVDDVRDLQDGDIVVFDCDGEYSVKRFFDDHRSQTLVFNPDSTFDTYRPILYRYEDTDDLEIVGKVAMYVVTL